MIRWKYAGPRLGVLAVVLLAYWFLLDPLVRHSLVKTGQAVTGAKVELGSVRTSLFNGRVHLYDLQVADPRSPTENLVEIGEATLELETGPLAERKFVVRRGIVTGLRFNTRRRTSGALETDEKSPMTGFRLDTSKWADQGLGWLKQVGAQLGPDLEEQLESVRLVRELADRWPAEYERLRQRAEELYAEADRLRAAIQSVTAGANPLRQMETFRQATTQAVDIQQKVAELRAEIERLSAQVVDDGARVEAATQRDIVRIREIARLDSLDEAALTRYLLGPQTAERTGRLVTWIKLARKYMPRKATKPKLIRGRGTTYVFAESEPSPDLLVRSLILQGEGRHHGAPFLFAGKVEGLTSQPRLYAQPTRLAAKTAGSLELAVQVYLDNAGEQGHDRLTIRCDRLDLPELVLGREDELALTIASGTGRASAVVDLAGDALAGRLTFERDNLTLHASLGPQLGGPALASRLEDAVSGVKDLHLAVSLSGTIDKPRLDLETDFGRKLAAGMERLIRCELEGYRDQLVARLEQRVDAETADLALLLADRRQQVLDQLRLGDDQINELKQQVASRIRLPKSLLGNRSPIQVLFR